MSVLKIGTASLLFILASCSGGKGATEPPPPPPPPPTPLTLSITSANADADSAVVQLSVSRTDAQVSVTFGEGTACSAATQAATKRSAGEWVLRPLRRGEIEYAVKATATAGGKTVEDCTTLTSFRHVDPCLDPREEWEMVEMEFLWVPEQQMPLSVYLQPLHIALVCGDRYELLEQDSNDVISWDEGKTFNSQYQVPVGALLAVEWAIADDSKGHVAWLRGDQIQLRLSGESAWTNPTRQANFSIPHGCAEWAQCKDGTPWLIEVVRREDGSHFLRP